jgi:hypothetical protein
MRILSAVLALPLLSAVSVSRHPGSVVLANQDDKLIYQGLHFYFESNEKRCFMEELPSDTIVEGEPVCTQNEIGNG